MPWGEAVAGATFTKPALSVADQLKKLLARGLVIPDEAEVAHYLEHIGYYRLSGYTLPFQIGGAEKNDNFRPGTAFSTVLDHYVFDRKLRLVVMDAIERIEVSFRSALSNSIATNHTPNWYQNPKMFRGEFAHDEFISIIKMQIGHAEKHKKRRDLPIEHYYQTYSSPDMPPCWMVFEAISFGTISQVFENLAHPEYQAICKRFGFHRDILVSWVHSISYIRNLCAHHSRLWNRRFTITPIAAKAHKPDLKPNHTLYAQLVVIQVLLKVIAPDNNWAKKVLDLLAEHPDISRQAMGFPDGWQDRPVWAGINAA